MSYGKIRANFIEHNSAGSLDTSYVVNGSAKHFSRINLSGADSITKSFNMSSITDYGTGSADLSYTNAFSDANYSLSGNHNGVSGNSASTVFGHDNSGLMTTSQVNVTCFNAAAGRVDATECSSQIWGDLA
jgi:hypothetical protein